MSNNRPINGKKLNQLKLVDAIKKAFPLRGNTGFSYLFPFSNDYGFSQAIEILKRFEAKKDEKQTVSLVFGESNFISLLPALSNVSDILLLADINKHLHLHTQFILDCFMQSNSPEEFKDKYFSKENPVLNKLWRHDEYGKLFDKNALESNMEMAEESVGKYYFLNDQNVYDECKKALEKMTLVPIHFDVSEPCFCAQLNNILRQHNAHLNFCNFTNIGEYSELKDSVQYLLKGHEQALILFSSRSSKNGDKLKRPRSVINIGLQDFLSTDMNKPLLQFDEYIEHMLSVSKKLNTLTVNQQLNLQQPNYKTEKVYGKCYSALSCDEKDMRNIIEGKLDIYSLNMTPALDSEDELRFWLKQVYEEAIKQRIQKNEDYAHIENTYKNIWILNLFNIPEKVHRYMYECQHSNSKGDNIREYLFRNHSKKDEVRIFNHLKLSSYVCSAQKFDGSMTIEKSMDRIPDKYKQNKYQLKDFAQSGLIKFNGNNPVAQDKEVLDENNKLSLK